MLNTIFHLDQICYGVLVDIIGLISLVSPSTTFLTGLVVFIISITASNVIALILVADPQTSVLGGPVVYLCHGSTLALRCRLNSSEANSVDCWCHDL